MTRKKVGGTAHKWLIEDAQALVIDLSQQCRAAAADVVDDLGIDAEAGELDQAALNTVRQHLRRMNDTRDYRIVRCTVNVQEGAGA